MDKKLALSTGKFKDLELKDVPAQYLLWCGEQNWFKKRNPEIMCYIELNKVRLEKEAEELDYDAESK